MHRRWGVWFVGCVVATLGGSLPAFAQRAGVVLVLPASARAAGAGDAAPLADGAAALFYGAAHLPAEPALSASAGTWIGGAQLASLAMTTRRTRFGGFGAGLQSLDYGSAEEFVPDPLTGGTRGTATGNWVGASAFAMTVGWALPLRFLHTGLAVAWLHEQVADLSGSVLAGSVGAGITLRGWDVDHAVQHVGQGMISVGGRRSTLASTQRTSVRTPAWSAGRARVVGVAEYRDVSTEERVALVGAEGSFTTSAGWRLSTRAAAVTQYVASAREGWSAGGSAARGAWSLDYAYQGFGALGAVHRMGVSWRSLGARSPSR
ncbi:MAG: hypothetical protein P3B98_03590 [Gemmatimonadota bacterium]|nr:hypothetical protein [Gemmatimonadota bacterium]